MSGVVMNPHIQRDKENSPYSALGCVLLLLLAGIFVKFGAAVQFVYLAN
jgi:hypothetical protein